MAEYARNKGIEIFAFETDSYRDTPRIETEDVVTLASALHADDVLLIKGSRSAYMERIVNKIVPV